MPVYCFVCLDCNTNQEVFKAVIESSQHPSCPRCGKTMKKNYKVMLPSYHDVPVDSVDTDLTGKPIVFHTRGQLKKIAKQHGCEVEFGTNRNHARIKT